MPTLAPPPTRTPQASTPLTVADLLASLGGVPGDRVRLFPLPGTATERDVIDVEAREDRLFELVDGALVEKPMGFEEALLAGYLITVLNQHVLPRDLGWVTAPDGMMRIVRGQVRMPDVAYVSRERAPDGKRPKGPIADVSPDLAVEVLSASNTVAEMARKRREYFEGGTRLVWEADPVARTVAVFTSPDAPAAVLAESDVLDGGVVLPGFTLPLAGLFGCLDD